MDSCSCLVVEHILEPVICRTDVEDPDIEDPGIGSIGVVGECIYLIQSWYGSVC